MAESLAQTSVRCNRAVPRVVLAKKWTRSARNGAREWIWALQLAEARCSDSRVACGAQEIKWHQWFDREGGRLPRLT